MFEIEANQSGSFSYTNADELYERLMKESYKWIGQMMIYELIVTAQDYMHSMLKFKHKNNYMKHISRDNNWCQLYAWIATITNCNAL